MFMTVSKSLKDLIAWVFKRANKNGIESVAGIRVLTNVKFLWPLYREGGNVAEFAIAICQPSTLLVNACIRILIPTHIG